MNSTESFLAAKTYAVAGASTRTHKYGYKVFKALLAAGRDRTEAKPTIDTWLFDRPPITPSLTICHFAASLALENRNRLVIVCAGAVDWKIATSKVAKRGRAKTVIVVTLVQGVKEWFSVARHQFLKTRLTHSFVEALTNRFTTLPSISSTLLNVKWRRSFPSPWRSPSGSPSSAPFAKESCT